VKILIKTLDLQRNVTAYLENAYGIGYEKINNAIWQASFSLPLNDPKVKKVELLKYVEITDDDEYIGLFRIIPKLTVKNESTQSVTFQCEHVLATLIGNSLFKYHQLTNYDTQSVLQYLIDQQKEQHWKLGTIEFTRYFHYSWENENLLSAIFSVPKPFDEQYRWTWDTTSYPWTLNLVHPDTEPTCRIREKHNLIGIEIEENPMSVHNRIYPLGYGEGVNQLGIESVNNGIPYIEDADSIAENGIIETVWVDRRFEDAATLLASGKAILKQWKEPIVTWRTSAADVSKITGVEIDKLKEGRIVRIEVEGFPVTDLRIMKESRSDIKGDPGNVQLEIGSISEDLSTTQADLERRQKVNEVYSQGATNIDSHDYSDNCDQNNPAVIRFYLPDDLVNVNSMILSYEVEEFRAYSRATKGGGAIVESTSSGGGVVKSTSSGGGSTQTSSSGGGSTQTSSSGGGSTESSSSGGGWTGTTNLQEEVDGIAETSWPRTYGSYADSIDDPIPTQHHHKIKPHQHDVAVPNHSHSVNIPSHTHSVTIPSHTHTVTIPNHSHDIDIPDHSHSITLPNHTHDIEHGIYKLSEIPTSVVIKVDGNVVPVTTTNGSNIDLIPYLSKDSSGRINRGQWHEVTITPNTLGRVNANIISRLFIQSRIGGTF
jgi:phage minor structural protein